MITNDDKPGLGLVVSIVDPQPGETIIDCCAAPGGKTLFMSACLNGEGNFWAYSDCYC